jgi:hypothetical protein
MRLLLVKAFAQNRYNVIFSKNSASYTRNNQLYFKAPLINDVYIVEEAQRVLIDIEELAADLWHRRLTHTNYKDILELQSSFTGID